MSGFVHLHIHTEYSLLDGACKINELPQRAKDLGQEAIAITDHGNMYGCIDFYRACMDVGIKPIIGCEVYVAPRTRFDKVKALDGGSRHLVLLCKNETGYKNLSYIVSKANEEGFYMKPRIDIDLLKERHEGLIALSACLAGEIPRAILEGNLEKAEEHAVMMRNIMGEGNYYLEVQDHGIPEQQTVNEGILKIHKKTGIPLVATNDAHYLTREDSKIQDILMCVQMQKTLADPNRMKFHGSEFYIKSQEEMESLFVKYPGAIENTALIAEQCNVSFEFGHYHLPEFKYPEGYDADSLFQKMCLDGFKKRYPDNPDGYMDRLRYEMDMIKKLGFLDYFLIVSDFVNYAKSQDIPVGPGRGSAAGSMVAYCMEITDIDPMKYALYFERFLNPERVTMPDIDMDFCYRRRGEVIEYVQKKYGEDHVAQIVTFGTMAARGVLRDVGRVLGYQYDEIDKLAKLVPSTPKMTLNEALRVSGEFKERYDNDSRVQDLVNTCLKLEGMPRHASKHAAGVVITKNPVHDYVPLARSVTKKENSIVTQYTMVTLEELGLLKMDFLGLRNLTILDDAEKLIQQHTPEFSIHKIPDNDPKVFEMLQAGQTAGVFQMESPGMTDVCVKMKASSIEDLTAVVAMYRPGPMDSIPKFIESKLDPSKISYLHPKLEPILSITYGCLVYQEQVMMIFQQLAGYSLGGADMVRRAISKKKVKQIEQERQAFIYGDESRGIAGCIANGVPEATAQAIYDDIYDFANYAFNKAHAVCYAVIAYQTAYFKCYYPKEYMAALLTSILDSNEKVSGYVDACRKMGISILNPDINQSNDIFTVSGENIRFGLAAIKNVGHTISELIVRERNEHGMYLGFQDFCERMYNYKINRRTLEGLILCGAFDQFHIYRSQLMAILDTTLKNIADDKKKNIEGQFSLFEMDEETSYRTTEIEMPKIDEFDQFAIMKYEKDFTGLYLSGHPMDQYKHITDKCNAINGADLQSEDFRDDMPVTVAGVIVSVKKILTKKNTTMAFLVIDDGVEPIDVTCFTRTLEEYHYMLHENSIVVIEGTVSRRNDANQVIAERVFDLSFGMIPGSAKTDDDADDKPRKIYVRVPTYNGGETASILAALESYPGEDMLILYCEDTGKKYGRKCQAHPFLVDNLKEIVGAKNVVVKQYS